MSVKKHTKENDSMKHNVYYDKQLMECAMNLKLLQKIVKLLEEIMQNPDLFALIKTSSGIQASVICGKWHDGYNYEFKDEILIQKFLSLFNFLQEGLLLNEKYSFDILLRNIESFKVENIKDNEGIKLKLRAEQLIAVAKMYLKN